MQNPPNEQPSVWQLSFLSMLTLVLGVGFLPPHHPSPTAALQAIHPIIPILGGNSFVVAPKKNLI